MGLIKKPNEVSVNPKLKALIYGQSGIGKTTLALSAPKPLLFDCDNGFYRTNKEHWCPTIQVSAEAISKRVADANEQGIALSDEEKLIGYDAIMWVINNEDISEYETIVIDTLGKLVDYMIDNIIVSNKGNSKVVMRDGSLAIGGYGVLKGMFSDFCRNIVAKGKHLIFVAHDKGKTAKGSDIEKREVLCTGSSYENIKSDLDIVLFMSAINNSRVITANPSQFNDGKNTIGLRDVEVPIVVNQEGQGLQNTFFSDYIINPYNERMKSIEDSAKEYHSLLKTLDKALALITNAKTANEFSNKYFTGDFQHQGNSLAYIKTKFRQIIGSIPIKYDAKKNCFIDVKQKKTEEAPVEVENANENIPSDGSEVQN